MTGWRLETAILVLSIVALSFLATAASPDVWTAIYATAAAFVAAGLICAKWAAIRARAGHRGTAWLLGLAAALLLVSGATLTVLILLEPATVDNGGHIL